MRIAAKAVDHRLVPALRSQRRFKTGRRQKPLRLHVNEARFRMDIGHVKESPFFCAQRQVCAGGDGRLRKTKGERVAFKGFGLFAKNVPCELVQRKDFCEPPLRRRPPRKKLTAARGAQERREALCDNFVKDP